MDTYQQDALAEAHDAAGRDLDDDDDDDMLDDDMMDRISSSPSIEDEDIDFDFVYALHTFVATVEGQANATKGDTMVLLDDSNSYWWLVRVVKDSSIGYLPAEHIETPTERLARLNKHRNIDLSATMLGDQAPRQKPGAFNSIVKRKKATVAFAEPTYFDYSDFDYSTDEDDIDELFGPDPDQRAEDRKRRDQRSAQAGDGTDGSARVEPLRTRSSSFADSVADDASDDEASRSSIEIVDDRSGLGRARDGTSKVDSFFGDEETKKITLTPNLLRDDNASRPSNESLNKTRTSLEKLERELVSDKERKKLSKDRDRKDKDKDREKDKEKEKEKERERDKDREKENHKKPSAIRSFFSRKDKKRSIDEGLQNESLLERTDSEDRPRSEPASPDRSAASHHAAKAQTSTIQLASYLAEGRVNNVSNMPPASMRIVNPETNESREVPSAQPQMMREAANPKPLSVRAGAGGLDASRPPQAVAATADLAEDSDDDASEVLVQHPTTTSAAEQGDDGAAKPVPGAFPETQSPVVGARERAETPRQSLQSPLSRYADSPAGLSINSSSPIASAHPPALVSDTESPEDHSPPASPSPELVQSVSDALKSSETSSSSKEHVWDDTKLRAFFDEGDHVRDLLTVVYDKSDVVAAGYDHPIVGGLFREQNAKLAEITTQLDNMLGDWLARKQRLRGTI